MGASVALIKLRKTFGRVIPVDNVSLSMAPGEFVTLLGPSGSGKTTTLMMIAGFEHPDSGEILLDGDDITHLPSYRRPIGVVFQNYALFPHMTVFENVAFSLRMRNLRERQIESRVGEALELVRLTGFDGRYPRQLSGGQQQRVALARALVFEPALLLLDEPLGALDRQLREVMKFEFRNIREKLATTIIYVTHDQEEALALSDRIAVMNHGRIEQIDSAVRLYERPANMFVAQFIGESNFVQGEIVSIEAPYTTVRCGPIIVRCRVDGPTRAGERVVVGIRPERIAVAPGSNERNGGYRAIVDDAIYVGEAIKYVVRLSHDAVLVAKEQQRPNSLVFQRGDAVLVSWDSDDVRCFRENTGAQGGRTAS
jgi:spermidine/putrescine ABC transporter ATP-binding subunit